MVWEGCVTPMPCGHRAPLLGPALGAQVGLLSHGLCVLCASGSLWHFSNLLSCQVGPSPRPHGSLSQLWTVGLYPS